MKPSAQPPAVVLMAGLQGAGKTTSVGKLGNVQPDRQYHALLPVYFFLDTRWSDFMGKNKLADVCERLYLLVVYHAGRHAGFNQVPTSI